MKITLIGSAYPFRGGLAAYNERLVRELMHLGHDVRIYTFTVQYPSFLFPGKTQFAETPPPEGLHIERAINSINPFNWLKMGWRIKGERPDIVVFKFWLPFMGPAFGTLARIIKLNKHTRIYAILDNVIPHEKRFGDVWFTRYFLKPVDRFVAMSQSVLTDLRTFTKDKPCALQPHPVFDNFGEGVSKSEACQYLKLDETISYILFFGFIRGYKGLDILLQALADERLQQLPFKLLVAGEFYEDRAPYDTLIAEKNLTDKVILHTHFIRDDEVKYYFSACDIVVLPYKHATQSGVTQIAYQFEKPMLVSNVGGLPELVPDGIAGYITEPERTAIANALHDFYTNNKQQAFNSGLTEMKKRFSWEAMCKALLGVKN